MRWGWVCMLVWAFAVHLRSLFQSFFFFFFFFFYFSAETQERCPTSHRSSLREVVSALKGRTSHLYSKIVSSCRFEIYFRSFLAGMFLWNNVWWDSVRIGEYWGLPAPWRKASETTEDIQNEVFGYRTTLSFRLHACIYHIVYTISTTECANAHASRGFHCTRMA